jgi:hypothetical protein
LVYLDHFVNVFESFNGSVFAGLCERAVEMTRQRAIENVVNQRGLA